MCLVCGVRQLTLIHIIELFHYFYIEFKININKKDRLELERLLSRNIFNSQNTSFEKEIWRQQINFETQF